MKGLKHPATAIAVLALFVTLGGTAYASGLISGSQIKNAGLGSVTPNKALIRVDGAATRVTISGN